MARANSGASKKPWLGGNGEFKVHGNTKLTYASEILGYFPRGSYKNTESLLKPVITQRKAKMKHFLRRTREVFKNNEISWESFLRFHTGGINYDENLFTYMKPHLFSYLKHVGILEEIDFDVFKTVYFDTDGPKNLSLNLSGDFRKLKFEVVVSAIKKDVGFAVIPHLGLRFVPKDFRKEPINPNNIMYQLRIKRHIYQAFLQYCKEQGVWGVKMYYYKVLETFPNAISAVNKFIRQLAKDKFELT